jgi:uncharacterized damage-inducible protein DinB
MKQNIQYWQQYLKKLNDSNFDQIIFYQNYTGTQLETKLSDSITHLINPGNYHRGQIIQLLKHERTTLRGTDYIFWIR